MNYQSSGEAAQGISGDLVIVASLAAAFTMFVAGYGATRASLGESSTQVSNLDNVQINVVGHEGTLWESVSK
ncbi:MAG: hypothetical protein ACFCU8_09650 [Thermosynechococcaceae cyanobacterium]